MTPPQRIASLVPSSTEMLFALGLGDRVVAVTHECDWPPEATRLPRLTRSVIPEGLEPAAIDAAVRETVTAGRPLYELDVDALQRLEVDLIVTQQLCAVCAVSYEEVCSVAAGLPGDVATLSLDPQTLDEVLGDVVRLGEATGTPELAQRLLADLQRRLAGVRRAVSGAERPRVLALEWHDPPFVGGHWVPEMIEAAGGVNVLGEAGGHSVTASWEELAAAAPQVVVSMPCGYYLPQASAEARRYADRIAGTGAARLAAVDAAASFSRPGPRLVEGAELLAHLLHPDRAEPPEGVGGEWIELDSVHAEK